VGYCVGDRKMYAMGPQAFIHAGGNDYWCYLCLLLESHLSLAVLADDLAPLWAEAQALTVLHRSHPGGTSS
jgi:hypothetical protein